MRERREVLIHRLKSGEVLREKRRHFLYRDRLGAERTRRRGRGRRGGRRRGGLHTG